MDSLNVNDNLDEDNLGIADHALEKNCDRKDAKMEGDGEGHNFHGESGVLFQSNFHMASIKNH